MKTADNDLELYKIAQKIIEEEKILTTYDTEEIYFYEEGYFKPSAKSKLKEKIDQILGQDAKTTRVNEIMEHIKRKTYAERNDLNATETKYINLQNGIYNTETNELKPHAWNHCFTYKLPINYNPSAIFPQKIDEFIQTLVGEDKKKLAYQIIAYCYHRNNPFKLAVMLYGNTNSGKTTFLKLLETLFGLENISNTTLQEFATDKFSRIDIFGKHLNIFDDLPHTIISDTGLFKAITGNGTITGQKKFQDRIQFKPFCKMIFATNQIPRPLDDSDAYYDRWILLNFPNVFEKTNSFSIEELLVSGELEGLQKHLLEVVLPDLLVNGFDYPLSVEEKRKLYISLSDLVGTFLSEKTEIEANCFTPKEELYKKFVGYCREKRAGIISEKTFSRAVYSIYPKIEESRVTPPVSNERIRCWTGLKFLGIDEKDMISFSRF